MTLDVIQLIRNATKSAWRLEQQPRYASDFMPGHYERWLAGDPIVMETERPWCEMVTELSGRGVEVARVRVHEAPPTEINKWSRWKGQVNTAAGEKMHYLDRSTAERIDLGADDWWLIDRETLVVMAFDPEGELDSISSTTDPNTIESLLAKWAEAIGASEIDTNSLTLAW